MTDPERVNHCHANRDGECFASDCTQLRDDEPKASGRHCLARCELPALLPVDGGLRVLTDLQTLLDRVRGASVLTIPVNGVYFDQIKAGTKPEEYRLVTPFWSKRLVGRTYAHVTLTRGYPKANDAERRLTLPWRGYVVKTITHPHFGSEPVEVFAIDVSALIAGRAATEDTDHDR